MTLTFVEVEAGEVPEHWLEIADTPFRAHDHNYRLLMAHTPDGPVFELIVNGQRRELSEGNIDTFLWVVWFGILNLYPSRKPLAQRQRQAT